MASRGYNGYLIQVIVDGGERKLLVNTGSHWDIQPMSALDLDGEKLLEMSSEKNEYQQWYDCNVNLQEM